MLGCARGARLALRPAGLALAGALAASVSAPGADPPAQSAYGPPADPKVSSAGLGYVIPLPQDISAMEPAVVEAIRSAVERASTRPKDAEAIARLGMLYNANFLTELSVSCYRRAAELDPQNPKWHYLSALAAAELGDPSTAEGELRAVLKLSPGHRPAMFHLGEILFDTGRTEEAERWYARVRSESPQAAAGYFGLGRVEYRRKRYRQARALWDQALQRAPQSERVMHHLGLVCRRLGRLQSDAGLLAQAKQYLAAVRGAGDTNLMDDPWRDEMIQSSVLASAVAQDASTLLALGRFQEAGELYRDVVRRHPDHWGFVLQLANLCYAQGRKAESRQLFERATKIAPQNPEAWGGLAEICRELGDLAATCVAVGRAAALAPEDVRLAFFAGNVFLEAGRLEQSAEAFRRVLVLNESHAAAAARLADVLNRLQRYFEALPAARRAVALDPQSAYAHFQLATALDHTGDLAAAQRELEITLSLQPSSTVTRHYLEQITEQRSARRGSAPPLGAN